MLLGETANAGTWNAESALRNAEILTAPVVCGSYCWK